MRAAIPALLAAFFATSALAQNTGAGGQGKETFQNLRSFTIRNDSKSVVASVKLISTNGGQVLFEKFPPDPAQPVRGGSGRA